MYVCDALSQEINQYELIGTPQKRVLDPKDWKFLFCPPEIWCAVNVDALPGSNRVYCASPDNFPIGTYIRLTSDWVPDGALFEVVSYGIAIVEVLADTNQALAGLPTIDTITLVDGEIALLVNQTAPSENGPWVVHAGAWTRPIDYDTGDHAAGVYYYINNGVTYIDQGWICTNRPTSDIIDTDDTTWIQFAASNAPYGSYLVVKDRVQTSYPGYPAPVNAVWISPEGWVSGTAPTFTPTCDSITLEIGNVGPPITISLIGVPNMAAVAGAINALYAPATVATISTVAGKDYLVLEDTTGSLFKPLNYNRIILHPVANDAWAAFGVDNDDLPITYPGTPGFDGFLTGEDAIIYKACDLVPYALSPSSRTTEGKLGNPLDINTFFTDWENGIVYFHPQMSNAVNILSVLTNAIVELPLEGGTYKIVNRDDNCNETCSCCYVEVGNPHSKPQIQTSPSTILSKNEEEPL